MDIVERKTVAFWGWYRPPSVSAVKVRQMNGNCGNFMWAYGATRMINPYTTAFINYNRVTENVTVMIK